MAIGTIIIAGAPWALGYIVVYFTGSWNLSSQSSVTNNYEVFRDLLIIFTTIAAIAVGLGVWAYDKFTKRVSLQIENKMRQNELVLLARSNAMSSYHDWEEYEYLWLSEGWRTAAVNARMSFAIQHAQLAYEIMLRAEAETRAKNDELMCQIKSNLAYHLAARCEESDYERAQGYAEDIWAARERYPKEKYDFAEVYWWVVIRYASRNLTLEYKWLFDKAVDEIKTLLSDVHVELAWQESVKRKYKTIYPWAFQ